MWPDRVLIEKLGLELPIIQAPMAGANGVEMAVAVSKAGGLGSLPCAMIDSEQFRDQMQEFRQQTGRPVNVNFFCHTPLRRIRKVKPTGNCTWTDITRNLASRQTIRFLRSTALHLMKQCVRSLRKPGRKS